MIMYDNEFETKENKIETKDEINPPHLPKKGINLGCLEFVNWRQVLYGCRKCCIFV